MLFFFFLDCQTRCLFAAWRPQRRARWVMFHATPFPHQAEHHSLSSREVAHYTLSTATAAVTGFAGSRSLRDAQPLRATPGFQKLGCSVVEKTDSDSSANVLYVSLCQFRNNLPVPSWRPEMAVLGIPFSCGCLLLLPS